MNPLTNKPYSKQYYEIKKIVDNLPASSPAIKKDLKKVLDKYSLVLLTADTGAGKSTSIVAQIAEYFKFQKVVVCTQPRKIPAKTTAEFMSKILDVELGKEVGYQYRGENRSNKDTKVKFVTDGLLMMEAFDSKKDKLSKYGAIIIDEAHERTVSIDIILYFLKRRLLQQKKDPKKYPEIKVIIMSATIQLDLFQNYFKSIAFGEVHVSGRTFPVKSFFLDKKIEYRKAIVMTVNKIIQENKAGDILIFLPSKGDIKNLTETLKFDKVKVFGLYSGVPRDQLAYITDDKKYKELGNYNRKIVLSTNVAETSVTIDGIIYVIDSGYQIEKKYQPSIKGYEIKKKIVSQASIKQRIGRAGRTRPGVAYHMYTDEDYKALNKYNYPSIVLERLSQNYLQILKSFKRVDQVNIVLQQLIQPPSDKLLKDALDHLGILNLIKDQEKITKSGIQASLFPVDPSIAVMISKGIDYNCEVEALELGAMLSINTQVSDWFNKIKVNNRLVLPPIWRKIKDESGDHLSLLKLYRAYFNAEDRMGWCKQNHVKFSQMREVSSRFLKFRNNLNKIKSGAVIEAETDVVLEQMGGDINKEGLIKCLIYGFFHQIAKNKNGKLYVEHIIYPVKLQNSNLNFVKNECIYTELVETRDFNLNIVTELKPNWKDSL